MKFHIQFSVFKLSQLRNADEFSFSSQFNGSQITFVTESERIRLRLTPGIISSGVGTFGHSEVDGHRFTGIQVRQRNHHLHAPEVFIARSFNLDAGVPFRIAVERIVNAARRIDDELARFSIFTDGMKFSGVLHPQVTVTPRDLGIDIFIGDKVIQNEIFLCLRYFDIRFKRLLILARELRRNRQYCRNTGKRLLYLFF